jgi:type IV fimbrial biogenesis protein FimT
MLTLRRNSAGATLIELMIAFAVFAILMVIGVPMFSAWIQSSQIRTSAESILDGLGLARAEAVHQNKFVSFQFVTTVTGSCAVSASGANWVVSRDDPSGKCDQPPSDSTVPRIVQKRAANEGSPNAVVAADRATIMFNGTGQVTGPASPARIDVTNPTGGTCAAAGGGGGPMRCLRVEVTTAGQIRMCDPARSSTDPQAC